jgi:serine/threonine-protein kinase HipA
MVARKQTLQVLMNGLLVGRLERLGNGGLRFSYAPSWREHPGARPISLSLPLSSAQHEGTVVYNFFDNLLPDNPRIRARIQARFQAPTDQPFDLLANIGRDCIGAIQICDEIEGDVKQISAEPLSDQAIASLLQNYQQAPLGMDELSDDFRISIAGAQEKSALLFHEGRWCRPLGTTPTSHILKLPIGVIEHQQMDLSQSCENEWLCAQLVKAFGLPVAPCYIHHFAEVKVLVVERFDRQLSPDKTWLMRLPQEDLCQALGFSPNLKYQSDGGPGIANIMKLLLASHTATADRELFFKSQVIFWLLAAIDGHAKNFSVFLEPVGRYRLTPLYDIMSAHPLMAHKQLQAQKIKMAMALIGKNNHYHWQQAQRRHFISTAEAIRFNPKTAETILNTVLDQVDTVIFAVSNALPHSFPSKIAEPIFRGMLLTRDKLRQVL